MNSADKIILVIGSLHHDIMLDAEHLPRTGETVTGSGWHTKFGGKGGNQAVAAARASAGVRMVSAVGRDAFARPLLNTLDTADVDRRWVTEITDSASGMSVAISNAQGDYGAVIVSGANLHIDSNVLDDEQLWHQVGLLCLQNEVDESLNVAAANHARVRSIPVCLNAAPARALPDTLFSSLDILVVNEIELAMLCNEDVDSMQEIRAAAAKLALRVPVIVVTLGERGVVLQVRGKDPQHIDALKINVKSTHGAGDVFIGHFCAELIKGTDIEVAVQKANAAAGQHVAGL